MKKIILSTIPLLSVFLSLSSQTPEQAFSVRDDIAMVRFSDPSPEHTDHDGLSAKVSPDGKYAAVVTTKGLLESDQIESEIELFDLDTVDAFVRDPARQAPKPQFLAAIAARPTREQTAPYTSIIKDLRWSPDARRLYFRAANPVGAMQLYVLIVANRELHALSPPTLSVDRFDFTNDTIAYIAARVGESHALQGTRINRDALSVTGGRIMHILFSGQMPSYEPETFILATLRVADYSMSVHSVPGYQVQDITLLTQRFPFKLSPNGSHLVTIMPVASIPASWQNYEPAPGFESRKLASDDPDLISPDNPVRPRQYALIDLRTGKTTPVVNSPSAQNMGYAADIDTVAWAGGGSRLLVTNVYFPLDDKTMPGAKIRSTPCSVMSIDLPSLNAQCVLIKENPASTPVHVANVRFGFNDGEAIIATSENGTRTHISNFELRDGVWKETSEAGGTAGEKFNSESGAGARQRGGHSRVFIRQGLNEPPALWASTSGAENAQMLWDPNPQLRHITMGEASIYRWKDKNGTEWIGGLVKPVGYILGKRYPLILQMYQFREKEFLTDGTDPSAFAARQLASAGFVVLQIRKKPNAMSEVDPQTHLEAYRSAIQHLAEDGLVDSSRVGVVGFSWTCWYAVNALIKAPKLFAAATIADGLDNSYVQYILFSPGPPSLHAQMDQIRGGSPIGPGLERWVKEAPGFHTDQIQTPVRIEAINPTSVLQEWELYASLYLQHKPVDLIYFPEGTHIHQLPQERLESQQGNIDWLSFWLQGYEDPNPAKRSQYERWRAMRKASEDHQHGPHQ